MLRFLLQEALLYLNGILFLQELVYHITPLPGDGLSGI